MTKYDATESVPNFNNNNNNYSNNNNSKVWLDHVNWPGLI